MITISSDVKMCFDDGESWVTIIACIQNFLETNGYVFHKDFYMAEILEEAHENLLAGVKPTSDKPIYPPLCVEDNSYE